MTTPIACPSCGVEATGRFCSSCGATVTGGQCPECNTVLASGVRYCHRCGASVSSTRTPSKSGDSAIAWAVAAIALVALTALIAGRQFRGRTVAEATPLGAPSVADGIVRAPDISQLTPAQRAEALFDRMMRLNDAGEPDSVRFFAPMAIAAYQMIEPLDDDQRFDLGRIGIMTGLVELARAQSDTILSKSSSHLLGLMLGISAAETEKNEKAAKELRTRLLAVRSTELAKNLPEYQRHRSEIAEAIAKAQGG